MRVHAVQRSLPKAAWVVTALALVVAPSHAQIGTVRAQQEISALAGGLGGPLDPLVRFGQSIVSLGDLDGDGVVDLAVGSPADQDGGVDQGAVWILFLNTDGTVKAEQKISETAGGFGGVLSGNDHFGQSVAALGDLDGDGTNDLLVGAHQDNDGGLDQGAAWVLFLNPDGTVKAEQKISETAGGFGGTLDPSDYFGVSCTALGDLDGDGVRDIAVGAFEDDDGGTDQGAVWILFLNTDGTVKSEQKISETSGGFGGDLDTRDWFGFSVGALGDLDGDGIDDLAVGAYQDDDGGTDQGAVWILSLDTDGTVKSERKISATSGGFAGQLHPGDIFGSSVTLLGDLDGDGNEDLAVGALGNDDGDLNQGGLWILFLGSDGLVRCEQEIAANVGGFTGNLGRSDNFGYSVARLGDLDGDGILDLAAGAPASDIGNTDKGAIFVLFLTDEDTEPPLLSCPAFVSVVDSKGGPPGSVVSYSVTASDGCDPAPSVVCVPPSGSFFPRGTTMVTCTATDTSGNQTVCVFPVFVFPTLRPRRL